MTISRVRQSSENNRSGSVPKTKLAGVETEFPSPQLLPLAFFAPTVNDQIIKAIVGEVAPVLAGGNVGKIFQLSRLTIAIDFRIRDGRYLFLSIDPQTTPRFYLIERRVRDLEKQSLPPGSFVMTLHKRLAGARLVDLTKDEGDRIVRFAFAAPDLAGKIQRHTLVAQLTGRASNLLLLDEDEYVIDSLRTQRGRDREGAEKYEAPASGTSLSSNEPIIEQGPFKSLSEAADDFYAKVEAERGFASRVSTARARLKREVSRRVKLREHLLNDLATHGDAETHKRMGELLMANVGTAERHGETVTVTDYYTEGMPRIDIQVDENRSLSDEAARRFTRYTKARRASDEIARRLLEIEVESQALAAKQEELEDIIAAHDEESLDAFFADAKKKPRLAKGKNESIKNLSGARRYLSSDGYEILVGRAAKDNDHLTFRIARPYDLWLHAANYPGSHVIILNPTRKEIPHRTVVEAAQLAAKFSQARRDGKVDVHYTQRKFLAKPKGSASGLVRMSNFRTIIVEPGEGVERI